MTMTTKHGFGLRIAAASGAMLFALAGLIASSAYADQKVKPISGHFDTQISGCASPGGLCAVGEVTGSLSGTIELTAQSVVPTADPNVALINSTSVLHTRDGDIYFKDSAVAELTGEGEFASLDRIVGGTGKYAGASGYMRGLGNVADGRDFGTYEGKVVLA